jgi:hypothetical protein
MIQLFFIPTEFSNGGRCLQRATQGFRTKIRWFQAALSKIMALTDRFDEKKSRSIIQMAWYDLVRSHFQPTLQLPDERRPGNGGDLGIRHVSNDIKEREAFSRSPWLPSSILHPPEGLKCYLRRVFNWESFILIISVANTSSTSSSFPKDNLAYAVDRLAHICDR